MPRSARELRTWRRPTTLRVCSRRIGSVCVKRLIWLLSLHVKDASSLVLRLQLEFEKAQKKKLEKDLRKSQTSAAAAAAATSDVSSDAKNSKHKQIALMLIHNQKRLTAENAALTQRTEQLLRTLHDEQAKTKEMAESLAQENQKLLRLEAVMERDRSDHDTEREQLKHRLQREETLNRTLRQELEKIRNTVAQLADQQQLTNDAATHDVDDDTGIYDNIPAATKSDATAAQPTSTSLNSVKASQASSPRLFNQTNSTLALDTTAKVPPHVEHVAPQASPRSSSLAKSQVTSQFSPQRPLSAGSRPGAAASQSAQKLSQALDKHSGSSGSVNKSTAVTSQAVPAAARARVREAVRSDVTVSEAQSVGKPIPAEKPSELHTARATSSVTSVPAAGGATSAGTTVFTTPSGTRISLNVGPGSAPSSTAQTRSPRASASRDSPLNRNPPPIPSKPTGLQTPVPAPRKETPARGSSLSSVVLPVQHHQTAPSSAATRISAVAQRFEAPQQHSPRSVTSSHSAGAFRYAPAGGMDASARGKTQHPPQVSLFK